MSGDDGHDGDELGPVGYCRPPAQHRFEKGKSGNPRGRPPKPERSWLPRQLRTDILAAAERPMRIKAADGDKTMAAQQVIFMVAMNKAAAGDLRAIKYVAELIATAHSEHFEAHKISFDILEQFERHLLTSAKEPDDRRTLALLNQMRRATRRK